jgi:hypothetical protein
MDKRELGPETLNYEIGQVEIHLTKSSVKFLKRHVEVWRDLEERCKAIEDALLDLYKQRRGLSSTVKLSSIRLAYDLWNQKHPHKNKPDFIIGGS